jgi:hypothetical protein
MEIILCDKNGDFVEYDNKTQKLKKIYTRDIYEDFFESSLEWNPTKNTKSDCENCKNNYIESGNILRCKTCNLNSFWCQCQCVCGLKKIEYDSDSFSNFSDYESKDNKPHSFFGSNYIDYYNDEDLDNDEEELMYEKQIEEDDKLEEELEDEDEIEICENLDNMLLEEIDEEESCKIEYSEEEEKKLEKEFKIFIKNIPSNIKCNFYTYVSFFSHLYQCSSDLPYFCTCCNSNLEIGDLSFCYCFIEMILKEYKSYGEIPCISLNLKKYKYDKEKRMHILI